MSPDGVEFQHVSPKLATLRLGNALALCGALCGAISGLVLIVDIPALWWLMLVPAAIALVCLSRTRPVCATSWRSVARRS